MGPSTSKYNTHPGSLPLCRIPLCLIPFRRVIIRVRIKGRVRVRVSAGLGLRWGPINLEPHISEMGFGELGYGQVNIKCKCRGKLYCAFLLNWAGKGLKLCSVLNGITQFYLPPRHFIPARAEQDLEHYIRNELLDVAAHFTDRKRMEAWVKLVCPGIDTQNMSGTSF